MTAEARIWFLATAALASLMTVALSAFWIGLRTGATWRDLGVDRACLRRDALLGIVAFAMLAPPVYGLQFLLVQWFPSQHPLVELLREHMDPALATVGVFSAVVVAPVAEEYFFRVLLQGWLERLVRPHLRWLAVVLSAECFAAVHWSHGPDPLSAVLVRVGTGLCLPADPPPATGRDRALPVERRQPVGVGVARDADVG